MPKIAVAGVKGSTGREFLNLLAESSIPVDDVFALEAKSPLGTLASYGEDDELDVFSLDNFDFKKADVTVFATTKEQGKRYIKKAIAAGCQVIDLSGATFGDSSVPLVVPEVNGEEVLKGGKPQVVAVPSSAVYQILLPLAGVIKENKYSKYLLKLLKDENAVQVEVDSAYNELVKAYLDLRLKPNKDLLEDLINQASGLNVANYTKASFDGLTKALNEAKVVFENPNATQKEVDNAKATLEKAINSLEANTPVDNTTNIPVSNGDTTSVKTGDESIVGMFATIALLSVAGYAVFRRKED